MEVLTLILISSVNMETSTIKMLVLMVIGGILLSTSEAQTDEDLRRPYKFGFNIENMQHRQEEKDEKGIIMGEYGYISPDGWYLTTIYATDEQGRFVIVGKKREFIGPSPFGPPSATTARPLSQPSTTTTRIPVSSPRPFKSITPTTFRPPLPASARPFQGIPACGSCVVPTTTQRPLSAGFAASTTISPVVNNPSSIGNFNPQQNRPSGDYNSGTTPSSGGGRPSYPSSGPTGGNNFPSSNGSPSYPTNNGLSGNNSPTYPSGNRGNSPSSGSGNPPFSNNRFTPTTGPFGTSTGSYNRPNSNPSTVLPFNDVRNPGANIQTTMKPIVVPNGGSNSGLDYRFKYLLGFQGHQETGYKDGSKTGNFFVNTRDGYGHQVAYQANEFGFQPVITQVKLSPSETPRQNTEKDVDSLKEYEFVWFRR